MLATPGPAPEGDGRVLRDHVGRRSRGATAAGNQLRRTRRIQQPRRAWRSGTVSTSRRHRALAEQCGDRSARPAAATAKYSPLLLLSGHVREPRDQQTRGEPPCSGQVGCRHLFEGPRRHGRSAWALLLRRDRRW